MATEISYYKSSVIVNGLSFEFPVFKIDISYILSFGIKYSEEECVEIHIIFRFMNYYNVVTTNSSTKWSVIVKVVKLILENISFRFLKNHYNIYVFSLSVN